MNSFDKKQGGKKHQSGGGCGDARRAQTHLLPAVLLQAVEQLVRVGEPEGQQHKILLVTLESQVTLYFPRERLQQKADAPRSSLTEVTFLTAPISAFIRDLSLAPSFR